GEAEVVAVGGVFLAGGREAQPIERKQRVVLVQVGVAGPLLRERQTRHARDVHAGRVVVPLVEGGQAAGLGVVGARPDDWVLVAFAAVAGVVVHAEHGAHETARGRAAVVPLEVQVLDVAGRRRAVEVAEGPGHVDRRGQRAGLHRAGPAVFRLAGVAAAVA